MFCQTCGARNSDEEEYCRRCRQKLLVLSGAVIARDEAVTELEEEFSFDEHLLERISLLEEALKRATETLEHLLGVVQKQQESLALNDAGLASFRELLTTKELVTEDEWEGAWERHRNFRLLALDKRQRFSSQRERIRGLYRGKRPAEFERLLEEAEYALASLDLERALEALEAAFRMDRSNHELAHLLGETLFNAGEPERALPYFERLLEVKPRHYEGLVYAGVLHQDAGDMEAALDLLGQAVDSYPGAFLPHFSLGAVHASLGDLDQARRHLERAVELDRAPQALYLLGRCLQDLGRSTGAIRRLEEAVQRNPTFEEAFYQLGLAYLDRGWTRKALEAFRQAQCLNPRKFQYRELVRYLADRGSSPFPEVTEGAAEALTRGERALEADEPEEAFAHFRRALRAAPEHPTVLTYYALACLALDRPQEIEPVVRKVVATSPGELLLSTAYATWIEALRSQGRFREGNRIGERLLAEGQSNVSKTIAYYEMAWNLAEMEEDLDEALDLARRALELAPEELRQFPLAALGWVHYKRQEFPQAVEYLVRASQLGTSSATLTQLGMALLASGDEEHARSVLDQARHLRTHGAGLEFKMMECLRDSNRLYARVQGRRG